MIYSGSGGQLYRISVDGGEPEQLSTYTSGDIGMKRYPYDCSPDGAWVVYHDVNENIKVGNTVKSPVGNGPSSYTKPATRLCLFNLTTRKTVEVFPYVPSVSFCNAHFIGNNTRLCYVMQDNDVYDYAQQFGIYSHVFDTENTKISRLRVDEAVPAPFALTGNHPNPFNHRPPSLLARKSGTVDLAIYDITGARSATSRTAHGSGTARSGVERLR